ncbi:hypothetical protein DID88_005280 [Monilinia fructigena]|uniref:Uncharacterized protein n=1 Tax=Monilinia fructigena TaxID=38457 RepID=A0A395J0L3_9HELO|nr:hypothetical protein DID88_005280 [Monilinia fructigena]
MEQLDIPASNLRESITSPVPTGMTAAQLEQVLDRTPQMTRFNLFRRLLHSLRTPDYRALKGEVTNGVSCGRDKVASTPKSSPTAQSPHSSIGEDMKDGFRETTVVVEVDGFQGTPLARPNISFDETFNDSEESARLEQLIRTARRTSNSQALNNPRVRGLSFSFGPLQLVRRAGMKSSDEDSDKGGEFCNINIAILGLADKNDSSQPTNGSEEAGVGHSIQERSPDQPRKQEEKEETSKASVQPSAELADDLISQCTSDALQVIETVGQIKRERRKPQTCSNGAFGKIDNRVYRFPALHNTSLQAEVNNRHEVIPSYSDGFEGSEAKPTGRFMLVPKQKRVSVSMWGLNTRVRQLELVSRKYDELIDQSNCQAKSEVPARKFMRPLNKKTVSSAVVLVEAASQASETDKNPVHVEGIPLLPQNMTVPRAVTFDQRGDVDRPLSISYLNSREFKEYPKGKERHTSSDFQVHGEVATVPFKKQSVVSILSNDDESEQSDETCDDSDEEMNTDTEDEDENGKDFDVPAALQGPEDDQADETKVSVEGESSEQSNEEDDNGENNHSFDENMDEQVSGGNATRISIEGLSQRRESSMEPCEYLIPDEPQITGAERESGDHSHPSQLSIARIWNNTTTIQEAEIWRPRKPKSSGVTNETSEDIFDSPSPALDRAKRRSSTGLQSRRKRKFSSLPLSLKTSRLNATSSPKLKENLRLELEIPETQFIAIRHVSPELGWPHGVNHFETPMRDEFLDKDGDILPPFSQLSFVPEGVPEGSYFYRASQTLMGSFHKPKTRAKSTPGCFHPKTDRQGITPAAVQSSSEDTSNLICETTISPKFLQLSYTTTPRSEKSLSSITRKASFALGTLPASVKRKRAKTLAFIPPFKKAKLVI